MIAATEATEGDRARSSRDEWLRLDDRRLLAQCREERYRASGPGGQRRNKVETAIRLHHLPSGAVSQAEESRSLAENRRRAIRRLRLRIALTWRMPFDRATPAPEVLQYFHNGTVAVNPANPAYALVVATVLDGLAAAGGSYAEAAGGLGLTTSRLVRFLQSDREVWRAVDSLRAAR